MIQVMGFPPFPGDDSSPDWQILLHGHFLPYALPTFFFAQFNPVSVSYTPLDNSKKFLSPCSIILSNICKWLLFLLSHYLAQPIWIRSFIFSCYPLPLAFSNFFGICAQNLSLKKNVLTALKWKCPNLGMRLFSQKLLVESHTHWVSCTYTFSCYIKQLRFLIQMFPVQILSHETSFSALGMIRRKDQYCDRWKGYFSHRSCRNNLEEVLLLWKRDTVFPKRKF